MENKIALHIRITQLALSYKTDTHLFWVRIGRNYVILSQANDEAQRTALINDITEDIKVLKPFVADEGFEADTLNELIKELNIVI